MLLLLVAIPPLTPCLAEAGVFETREVVLFLAPIRWLSGPKALLGDNEVLLFVVFEERLEASWAL